MTKDQLRLIEACQEKKGDIGGTCEERVYRFFDAGLGQSARMWNLIELIRAMSNEMKPKPKKKFTAKEIHAVWLIPWKRDLCRCGWWDTCTFKADWIRLTRYINRKLK